MGELWEKSRISLINAPVVFKVRLISGRGRKKKSRPAKILRACQYQKATEESGLVFVGGQLWSKHIPTENGENGL